MEAISVKQTIEPAADKFEPETITYTNAKGTTEGLSKAIRSISLQQYGSSMSSDISITVDDKSKDKVLGLLQSAGINAQEHRTSGSISILRIPNANPATAMIQAVTALAVDKRDGELSGVLRADTANQIIGLELTRTGKTAADLKLMTSDLTTVSNDPGAQEPKRFVTSDISYPLSPVSSMEELGSPGQPSTRLSIRSGNTAAIVGALNNAGIKAIPGVVEETNHYYVNAIAPADDTANALEKAGILPSFLANPIITQAAGLRASRQRMQTAILNASNIAKGTIIPDSDGNAIVHGSKQDALLNAGHPSVHTR